MSVLENSLKTFVSVLKIELALICALFSLTDITRNLRVQSRSGSSNHSLISLFQPVRLVSDLCPIVNMNNGFLPPV